MTDHTNQTDETDQAVAPAYGAPMDLAIFDQTPLWTPEIDDLAKRVAHWVRCDHPGAVVYGIQRIGKTSCCEYLVNAVPQILGGTTVAVKWDVEITKLKGELETIRDFLSQSGSTAINSQRIGILKARLFDHLIALANACNAPRIMIIVDEAHRLEWDHLKILLVIYNGIKARKKECFVLLMGEPSLKASRETYMANREYLQMAGRFFFSQHEFGGIDVNSLQELLESIDDVRRITEKYLDGRVPEGFRLASFAPLYKEAIENLAAAEGRPVPRFPMQFLRISLNDLIYTILEAEEPVKIDVALVEQVIRDKNFHEVLKLYVQAPQDESAAA